MSGSAGNLSVTIVGVDKATGVFNRIAANARRMTGPFSDLTRSVRSMSDATGVTRLAASMRNLSTTAVSTTRSFANMGFAIAGVSGAASIAGIVRMSASWAQFSSTLGRDSARIMSTVSQLHSLQGAARLSGASAEDMTSSLQGLGDSAIDALGGRNNDALQYLNILRVKLAGANGQARTGAELLPELANGIARIGDARLQARVLRTLGVSESLIPVLRRGAAGLKEYRQQAERYGLETEGSSRAARTFREAQSGVTMATQGLFNSISERLSPVLVPLMKRFGDWIARNRELIATGIGEWVQRMAKNIEAWVQGGGLKDLVGWFDRLGRGVKSLSEGMGGWSTVLKGVGILLVANLLSPVLKVTAALAGLAAFRAPAWLLRLLGVPVLGAAGGALAGMLPGTANEQENGDLKRYLRDPAGFDREQEERRRAAPPPTPSFFGRVGRIFERALSPRGGDRSVGGGQPAAPRGTPMSGIPNGLQGQTQDVAAGVLSRFPGARITSGHRPNSHGSQHQHGGAIDLSLAGLSQTEREELVRTVLSGQGEFAGVRGIGTYNRTADSVHVDTRSGPFAAWGPNRSRTSLGQTPDWFQRQVAERLARGDRPAQPQAGPAAGPGAAPTAAAGAQRVDVRVTLAGPGTEGARVTTRDNYGVRVESASPSFGEP